MAMIRCKGCGTEKKVHNKNQLHCSVSCSVRHRAPDSQDTRLKKSISHKGEKHYRWCNDREELDARLRLGNRMRKMLKRAMMRTGTEKEKSSFEDLGYTPVQLKEHLEKLFVEGMTWKTWGNGSGKWNIDHIKQIATWPRGSLSSDVNALTNLRPLWSEENLSRPRKEAL